MKRQRLWNLAAAIATALATDAAMAATITVNSPGDAAADDGACTLREAITAASTNLASGASSGECAAGEASPVVDTIAFAIPGAGVHTIQPASTMPAIAEAVVIDGYTQPGASPNTLAVGDDAVLQIEIDGSAIPGTADLLRVNASGTTVRGLVINRVTGTNIVIGAQQPTDDCIVEGNFLNTDATGSSELGGHFAVVRMAGSNNVLGGTDPVARNVIGGGAGSGSHTVQIGGNGNLVQGNYIGIDASGTVALEPDTGSDGIGVGSLGPASNTVIGGDVAGAGNVINATGTALVLGGGVTDTVIQGNYIGTDATSAVALGGAVGLTTNNGPVHTLIGGVTSGAGNVFSGLGSAIYLVDGPTAVVIQGNRFGTDESGTRRVPNRGNAIMLHMPGVDGSIIGGTEPGAANTIAYNCGQGVYFLFGPNHWPILGNSIHSNAGLGISFLGGAPAENDDGDADTGANDLQNYPVITSAVVDGGNTTVSGTLNSTPSTSFRVEFFANAICDASGHGEGQQFIGTTDVTTDASGNAAFGPLTFTAPDNAEIAATATDPAGNTSEFSACAGPHDHMFADGFDAPACG